jgi:GNAT superfamily N-acetyltransferase
MKYIHIDPASGEHAVHSNDQLASFLEKHLDQYGDRKEDILACMEYCMDPKRGGFIIAAIDSGEPVGAVVVNNTGMKGYIPENILVYIAVRGDQRGKGVGKGLMAQALERAQGSIALHVEPDNPARKLYESLGFTNKYLEMRLHR